MINLGRMGIKWKVKTKGRAGIVCLTILMLSLPLYAQVGIGKLSLEDAITIAKTYSAQAKLAKFSFMGQYWNYRSFRAELLPSLNASSGLGQYNRSLVEVRDPETGQISYVDNNSLTNDLAISINQNIPFLGGHLSLKSSLSRLDQFTYKEETYNSNPLTLNYTQPLRAYNTLKWKKKTAPLQYENSKKRYLETMQNITMQATNYFFVVLSAQAAYDKSIENYEDRKRLFSIAEKRSELGTTTRSEILQLKLSLLNAEMSTNTTKLSLDMQLFYFCSYLGIKQSAVNLIQPRNVPDIELNFDMVLDKAYQNSTHTATQDLKLLESRRALAQAKSAKGLQADFRVNLGLSQTAHTLDGAYQRLKDREVVGVSLSMPIYDWGLSKGRVKMAEADLDITATEIEQEEIDFVQDIKTMVIKFNNQARQCEISVVAQDIAKERYEITKKRFQNGAITVTDLNTAQEEFDNAQNQYINQLKIYWSAYYELQKIALYDFINKVDISAEFENLVK